MQAGASSKDNSKDSPDGSPSPKKLHEHAQNVRRAVEQRHQHNRSMEQDGGDKTSPRANVKSSNGGGGGFTENTAFYMME